MQNQFHDVTVRGARYRIGLLDAADGSWIRLTLSTKLRERRIAEAIAASQSPAPPQAVVQPVNDGTAPDAQQKPTAAELAAQMTPEQGFRMTATFLVEQLDRAQLKEVTALCMAVCAKYEILAGQEVAVAIMTETGVWLRPELKTDGPTCLELTTEAIAFNIAPFFTGAGSSDQTTPAVQSL
jgi:hypothetical protein